MCAHRGTQQVINARGIGDPLSESFVDRGTQGLVARLDRDHFGPEPAHAIDVRCLPFDVDGAHVNGAGQTDARAGRGRGYAVLAGAGLRDDALDAQPFGKQRLPDRVVDFVCARMREVFPLEPHVGAPAFTEPPGVGQRGGPADPFTQLALELRLELRIVQMLLDPGLEPLERGHQRLRNVSPAEGPEAPALVGQLAVDRGLQERFRFARL
jgi:hypothetical protein